jgi:hypothetical protein
MCHLEAVVGEKNLQLSSVYVSQRRSQDGLDEILERNPRCFGG